MYEFRGLLLDGADDFRVAVSGRADSNSGVAIEKYIAVNVCDPHAFSLFCDEFERRARVRGRDELRVGFDDLLPKGAGQRGIDLRFLRGCDCGHDTFSFY
jgi:hypothetical protein